MSLTRRGMTGKRGCENNVKQSFQKLNFQRNERWDGCQKENKGSWFLGSRSKSLRHTKVGTNFASDLPSVKLRTVLSLFSIVKCPKKFPRISFLLCSVKHLGTLPKEHMKKCRSVQYNRIKNHFGRYKPYHVQAE